MNSQTLISLLFVVLSSVHAQVAVPISQSDVYFSKDDTEVIYNINHRPELGGPESLVSVNRAPVLLPLAGVGPLPGFNVPRPIVGDVMNIPAGFQNPFQFGAIRSPFFNDVFPYGSRNAAGFLQSGVAPFSSIFNNPSLVDAPYTSPSLIGSPFASAPYSRIPYANSPFGGAPFFDRSYLQSGYGGFTPSVGSSYAVNPLTPWNYQGFNPYGRVF